MNLAVSLAQKAMSFPLLFYPGLLLALLSLVSKVQAQNLKLHFKPGPLVSKLLKETDIPNMVYRPHFLALNNHIQFVMLLIYEAWFKTIERNQIRYDREIFTLKDGGQQAIDWYQGLPRADDQRPILVCIAGLGSDTQAIYVRNMIMHLHRDFKCVFVQWRAQSGVPVTSNKLYSMASWRDVKEPVDYISQKYKRPLYLFGTSLGAIVSTNYLIHDAQHTPIRAAAFLNGPMDLVAGSEFIDGSIYSKLFAWVLKKKFRDMFTEIRKRSTKEQTESYDLLMNGHIKNPSLRDVDNYIVSPMFGFEDCMDYRRQCAVNGRLNKLKTPCFFLHAWDDFLIGPKSIPTREFEKCENIVLATTTRGAHCCFFEHGKLGIFPRQWFISPLSEYLRFMARQNSN